MSRSITRPLALITGLLISVSLELLLLRYLAHGIGISTFTLTLLIGCAICCLGALSSLNSRSLKYNAAVICVLILAVSTGTAR